MAADAEDAAAAGLGASKGGGVSRAAVRRLAHDAGVRMAKEGYGSTVDSLVDFMQELFRHATLAMSYSKKKSVCTDHVYYALQMMDVELPDELGSLTGAELKTLKKCNVHAAPDVRKTSPMSAEISEASFNRLVKSVAELTHENLRFSVKARHLIQLVGEMHLVRLFAKKRQGPVPFVARHVLTRRHPAHRICQVLLGGGRSDGQEPTEKPAEEPTAAQLQLVAGLFDRITSQIQDLLQITSSRTIDERVIRAATNSVAPQLVDAALVASEREWGDAVGKVISKVLRGQVVDKRITAGAVSFMGHVLAAALERDGAVQPAPPAVVVVAGEREGHAAAAVEPPSGDLANPSPPTRCCDAGQGPGEDVQCHHDDEHDGH